MWGVGEMEWSTSKLETSKPPNMKLPNLNLNTDYTDKTIDNGFS
jgi:hypothetical protein